MLFGNYDFPLPNKSKHLSSDTCNTRLDCIYLYASMSRNILEFSVNIEQLEWRLVVVKAKVYQNYWLFRMLKLLLNEINLHAWTPIKRDKHGIKPQGSLGLLAMQIKELNLLRNKLIKK